MLYDRELMFVQTIKYYAYIAATIIFSITQLLLSGSPQPSSSSIFMLRYFFFKWEAE